MPAFIDIPPAVRQEIDSIVADLNKARQALQSASVLPHVHKAAKVSLKRAARASYALARAL